MLLTYGTRYWFLSIEQDWVRYGIEYGDSCTAHDGWNFTGYQGLFRTLKKPVTGGCTSSKSWWSEGCS